MTSKINNVQMGVDSMGSVKTWITPGVETFTNHIPSGRRVMIFAIIKGRRIIYNDDLYKAGGVGRGDLAEIKWSRPDIGGFLPEWDEPVPVEDLECFAELSQISPWDDTRADERR